jgi:hypothetical protein
VTRLEIIAAIDAEIARLQRARFLIVQSAVERRSNGGDERRAQPKSAGKKQPVARDRRSTGSLHAAVPTVISEKPVLVTRLAPKEPPKRRIQAATKPLSALTRDVPQGPVAVPATKRETNAEAGNRTTAPTSAFGLAISRGLNAAGA